MRHIVSCLARFAEFTAPCHTLPSRPALPCPIASRKNKNKRRREKDRAGEDPGDLGPAWDSRGGQDSRSRAELYHVNLPCLLICVSCLVLSYYLVSCVCGMVELSVYT